MTNRDTILGSIRRHRPAACDLPDLHEAWTTYPDSRAQFIEVLTAVGGSVFVVSNKIELNEKLGRMPVYTSASRVASLVTSVSEPNVDLAATRTPHALADVDVAILPGEFGVAENGAVWVTDKDIPLRVIYFLCQHLILVVPAAQIVDHMHAAYERIASGGNHGRGIIEKPVFGAFISGPSKTADIEQSLVIGAHGPRSLTVFLLDE